MHVRNCKYNLRDFHMAILYVGQAMYVFVEQQRWINDMNRNQPNKYVGCVARTERTLGALLRFNKLKTLSIDQARSL